MKLKTFIQLEGGIITFIDTSTYSIISGTFKTVIMQQRLNKLQVYNR